MFNYLIIETKEPINDVKQLIIDFFASLIDINKIEDSDHMIVMTYHDDIDVLFDDVIHQLASDLYMDIRLYEAYRFQDQSLMNKHLEFIKTLFPKIPFNRYTYLDDEIIFKYLMTTIKKEDHLYIFRQYEKDEIMRKTVKTYLESNQNMSEAAKKLYIHRNTMMQRIDKFIDVTGFDVKSFVPASMIYYFLTH